MHYYSLDENVDFDVITTSVVIGRTNFIEVKVFEDKVAQEGDETFAVQLVDTSLHPAGFFLTDELPVTIIDTNGKKIFTRFLQYRKAMHLSMQQWGSKYP